MSTSTGCSAKSTPPAAGTSSQMMPHSNSDPAPNRAGSVSTFTPPLVLEGADKEALAKAGIGEPTVQKNGVNNGDTCHIDVVDRWGNIISATPSGGWLQSSPVVPELGFCLGTRLQMMWLDETAPSALTPGNARAPR